MLNTQIYSKLTIYKIIFGINKNKMIHSPQSNFQVRQQSIPINRKNINFLHQVAQVQYQYFIAANQSCIKANFEEFIPMTNIIQQKNQQQIIFTNEELIKILSDLLQCFAILEQYGLTIISSAIEHVCYTQSSKKFKYFTQKNIFTLNSTFNEKAQSQLKTNFQLRPHHLLHQSVIDTNENAIEIAKFELGLLMIKLITFKRYEELERNPNCIREFYQFTANNQNNLYIVVCDLLNSKRIDTFTQLLNKLNFNVGLNQTYQLATQEFFKQESFEDNFLLTFNTNQTPSVSSKKQARFSQKEINQDQFILIKQKKQLAEAYLQFFQFKIVRDLMKELKQEIQKQFGQLSKEFLIITRKLWHIYLQLRIVEDVQKHFDDYIIAKKALNDSKKIDQLTLGQEYHYLAYNYHMNKYFDDALVYYQQAKKNYEESAGQYSNQTSEVLYDICQLYLDQGYFNDKKVTEEFETYLEYSVYVFNRRKTYEMKNNEFYYWRILLEYGKLQYQREQYSFANETLKDCLELFDQLAANQKDRFQLIISLYYLAMSLDKSLCQIQAEEVLETCLQQVKQSQDLADGRYKPVIEYMRDMLVNKQNYKAEMKGVYEKWTQSIQKTKGLNDYDTAQSFESFGDFAYKIDEVYKISKSDLIIQINLSFTKYSECLAIMSKLEKNVDGLKQKLEILFQQQK